MNTRILRRRWVRAALLAVGSCALVGTFYWLCQPSAVDQLRPYLGRDLRTLSETEQFKVDGLVGSLSPKAKAFHRPPLPQTLTPRDWFHYCKSSPTAFPYRSWYLWQVSNDRLVLFQGEPLWIIPSSSSARIFVFDGRGRPLTECKVATGWRIGIHDARWLEDCGHGFPCLLVCSGPTINGADITSQYYALLHDTFALVRLEDSEGHFVSVNYHNPNHTIGPPVPERTPEQWEAALRSSDTAEVLRTLMWLGGFHSDPPLREEHICVEQFEDAALALATRARPGVRSAVEALTRSEDRWVREAAHHVREALRGREATLQKD